MTRARVDWLNQGEKPSNYLCSLERINYVEKMIKQVITGDSMTLTDQKHEIKLHKIKFFMKNFLKLGKSIIPILYTH